MGFNMHLNSPSICEGSLKMQKYSLMRYIVMKRQSKGIGSFIKHLFLWVDRINGK